MLNSWKEIASYLGRGVRTVQRYEFEYQLPVRRVQGKAHGSVLALAKDLDDWVQKTPLHSLDSGTIEDLRITHLLEKHREAISTLRRNVRALNERILEGKRIRISLPVVGSKHEGVAEPS